MPRGALRSGSSCRFAEKAAVNAREEILRSTTAEQRRSKTLSWLQDALRLTEFPHRIEAYDISNTGSTGIVASMTVHVDGKPLKRDYRKFRIRGTETPDDYASMREVITRRFTHYLDGDEKFSARPDVLFIDGGAEHASAACASLEALGLSLPVMSEWSELRLQTAPCRYWGTIQDGTLVILAHNYARHFGRLKELGIGDPAQFVDANGMVYPYEVAAIETLEPDEVNRMVDSEYDLTLFTCTYGGKHRVTVRLNRTKNLL